MTNDAENMTNVSDNKNDLVEGKTSMVTDQGQNLGGGKGQTGSSQLAEGRDHSLGSDAGQFDDEDEFSKTDQSIAQAAPGQTTTYTDQGGS